ncbi:hypothetical protein SFUMM280S_09281 [Streptomyces fumanus]
MFRALCPVETLYVGQRSRAVLSCLLRGRVDVAALSAAFDAMTQDHPTLRSRIAEDGAGYVLRLLDEDERPRLATRTGDPETAYAAELNRPLPVGGPLSRAALVSAPDGDSHLFVLLIDHTVTDGHSSIALHNALWDRYRALVGGEPLPHAPAGDVPRWPRPISESLPRPTPPPPPRTSTPAPSGRGATPWSWCPTTYGPRTPTGTSRCAGSPWTPVSPHGCATPRAVPVSPCTR